MERYRRHPRFLLLLLGCLLLPLAGWTASDSVPRDPRVDYLLQFSTRIKWPDIRDQQKFYIEIIGAQNLVARQLEKAVRHRKIHGKPVEIIYTFDWSNRSTKGRPHVVYVTPSAMPQLPEMYEFFNDYPVLIISERPAFDPGWMIAFEKSTFAGKPDQWSYSINASNIEEHAHLILPSFLRLASHVRAPRKPVTQQALLDSYEGQLRRANEQLIAVNAYLAKLSDTLYQQRLAIDSLYALESRYQAEAQQSPDSARAAFRLALKALPQEGEELLEPEDAVEVAPVHGGATASAESGGASRALGIVALISLLSAATVFTISQFFGTSTVGRVLSRCSALVAALPVAVRRRKKDAVPNQHAASTSQSEFLANVSHELRTPLNAIVGYSQYVASLPSENPEVKESLEVINQNAFSLMRVMDSMITLANLRATEVRPHPTECRLSTLFEGLFSQGTRMVHRMKRQDLVSLRYEIAPGVRPTLRVDVEKLTAVLEILLGCAIQNAEQGVVVYGAENPGSNPSQLRFYIRYVGERLTMSPVRPIGEISSDLPLTPNGSVELQVAQRLLAVLGTTLALTSRGSLEQELTFAVGGKVVAGV